MPYEMTQASRAPSKSTGASPAFSQVEPQTAIARCLQSSLVMQRVLSSLTKGQYGADPSAGKMTSSVALHALYWSPLNRLTPRTAKIDKTNPRNRNTFKRPASDASKDWIRKRSVLSALMERRGFSRRSKRIKVRRLSSSSWLPENSAMLTTTIRKSSLFHQSRKYDFLWITKPCATTFRANSTMKIQAKTCPETAVKLSTSVSS